MPHAAIIAAAVTAGVGGAIAFELGVFKPWREEHWPNGIAQGIKQEWDFFAEDIREGFREISGERQRQQHSHAQRHHQFRRGSEEEEEMALRREMDEFSMHEAQASGVRARLATEFQDGESVARRRVVAHASTDDVGKDESVGYHHPSVQHSLDSAPHHGLGEASPTITNTSLSREEEWQTDERTPGTPLSPRSPASLYEHVELPGRGTDGHSSSDEWHSRFSSPTASHNASDAEDDDSYTWTQLDASRSASPMSPSWSDAGLERNGR